MNSTKLKTVSLLLGVLVTIVLAAQPAAGAHVYHDWTSTFAGSQYTFTNTSSAGTISGASPIPGFAGASGASLPFAITTANVFTSEFQIHGTSGLGSSATFNFSSGYGWGTGGRLVLGNIHNYYEYRLSAWDFSNNPINVNAWPTLAEYPSTAPGTAGYFSTSSTTRTASGNSSLFYVFDASADANSGQGGVVHVDGLVNVAKIELTLTNSALAPNAQQVDYLLFHVGTPTVPEPASAVLLGLGAVIVGGWMTRRRRVRSTISIQLACRNPLAAHFC